MSDKTEAPAMPNDIEKMIYRSQLGIMNSLVMLHGSQDERTSIYTGIMMALVHMLWTDRNKEMAKTPEDFMNLMWINAGRQCLDTVVWYEKFERDLAEGTQPTTDQVGSA